MKKRIRTIVITGPTASGKTSLAVKLAREFGGGIISADSRQVYRGMDIGTGKDISEYSAGGEAVAYHLIDVADPDSEYNLMRFCRDSAEKIIHLDSVNKIPFICGGTALYLDALIKGYTLPGNPPDRESRMKLADRSPEELSRMLERKYPDAYRDLKDKSNPTRLLRAFEKAENTQRQINPISKDLDFLIIGVFRERKEIHERIEIRLEERLRSGMIEEVSALHDDKGISWEKLDYFGLEYRYVALYLQGKLDYRQMKETLLAKIRKFAKSQDVWFRKMEREGVCIHWIRNGDPVKASELCGKFLAGEKLPLPEIRIKDIKYGPSHLK